MTACWTIGPCILVFDPVGEYAGLSNYAESEIQALNSVWPTAEHLYQAQKFVLPSHRERIRTASSAAAAKAIAWGELTDYVRPDWDSLRVRAMEFTLRNKFLQNANIGFLLSTSFPLPIAEDSEQDSFWGIGSGDGENQLGRILESIRNEILGVPETPVTVSPLKANGRKVESRLAAVTGEYHIAPLTRALPAEYLTGSSLGMSIEELLHLQLSSEPPRHTAADDDTLYTLACPYLEFGAKYNEKIVSGASVTRLGDRSEVFIRALATAFDAKYADYCWNRDARSAVSSWPDRFFALLNRLKPDVDDGAIAGLVIGAGAGEEAANVWARFRGRLTLVDIGPRMVENSTRQVAGATCVLACAEDLHVLPTGSHDFYCALRVYQSLYFDQEMAIAEALRVLRPGGLFLVSVSDAYLSSGGKVERGQIVGNVIDNTAALNMACRVANLLDRMGFSDIGFADLTTELVVFAWKGTAGATWRHEGVT